MKRFAIRGYRALLVLATRAEGASSFYVGAGAHARRNSSRSLSLNAGLK